MFGRVMRVPYLSLLAIFGLYLVAAPRFTDAGPPAAVPRAGTVAALPDPGLTPGAVLTVDVARICAPGFTKVVRPTTRAMKRAIYAAYHILPSAGNYEIDHLIPLELGGANVLENLWPQPGPPTVESASDKNRLGNFLYRQVCAGRMPLARAQAEIAVDWLAAYRRYFGKS